MGAWVCVVEVITMEHDSASVSSALDVRIWNGELLKGMKFHLWRC